jgi:HPt (histidine-containing phosphotransfer) domain-containing protein
MEPFLSGPGNADSRPSDDVFPLDLQQLKRQTAGDEALEIEVLTLFLAKSGADLAKIRHAGSPPERRAAAHGLVGSAQAVGAREVARLARVVEYDGGETDIAALGDAVAEAQAYVRQLLR